MWFLASSFAKAYLWRWIQEIRTTIGWRSRPGTTSPRLSSPVELLTKISWISPRGLGVVGLHISPHAYGVVIVWCVHLDLYSYIYKLCSVISWLYSQKSMAGCYWLMMNIRLVSPNGLSPRILGFPIVTYESWSTHRGMVEAIKMERSRWHIPTDC